MLILEFWEAAEYIVSSDNGNTCTLWCRSLPLTISLKIPHFALSYEFGVGDILAISKLAAKVYTAYKNAPDDYKHISYEVKSLYTLINKVALFYQSSSLDNNSRQEGQDILKSCQSLLQDLSSLIEKYQSLASTKSSQVFKRVKLGIEDIVTLRSRLIANAGLLNGFIQGCEMREMQARLAHVLGLHRTASRVSIDSIVSIAGSAHTKKAYKEIVKRLHKNGVTPAMITQHESEIMNIFNSQNTDASSQIDDSSITDQARLPGTDNRVKITKFKRLFRLTSVLNWFRSLFSKGQSSPRKGRPFSINSATSSSQEQLP